MSRALSARSVLVAFTSASLLAVPGLTSAQPATGAVHPASAGTTVTTQAASRAGTHIRFLDFDHTRGWRKKTRIVGQVATPRGAMKGVRVTLYRKLDGSRFHRLRVARVGNGPYPRFVFTTRAIGNSTYRVVFRGNRHFQRSAGTTRVLSYRKVRAKIQDVTGDFHGLVMPNWKHRRVYLEKRSCAQCGWHKVRRTRTNGDARFHFHVTAPNSGRWWWRATVPASTRFIWSYSPVFTTTLE
jgi:5-hydroxyisourate hydrolase-like protein (transthyretin family)